MVARRFGLVAAALGGSAVALGAFGAHALRNHVSVESLSTWRTAVDYQFWHALALLAVVVWREGRPAMNAAVVRPVKLSQWAFATGVMIFSGSLYAIVLGAPRWLGAITPFGGVILIAGWLALLVAFWRAGREGQAAS